MNRGFLYVICVLAFALFAQNEALACSCGFDDSKPLAVQVREAKKRSDATFTGRVLKITDNFDKQYLSVEIEVVDVWKGKLASTTTVLTGLHDGNCRFDFKVGKTYLIYARKLRMYAADSLSTHMCTRTELSKDAQADIRILGNPRKRSGEIN
jgi:hypothetical protein